MIILHNFQGLATWLPDILFGAETKR